MFPARCSAISAVSINIRCLQVAGFVPLLSRSCNGFIYSTFHFLYKLMYFISPYYIVHTSCYLVNSLHSIYNFSFYVSVVGYRDYQVGYIHNLSAELIPSTSNLHLIGTLSSLLRTEVNFPTLLKLWGSLCQSSSAKQSILFSLFSNLSSLFLFTLFFYYIVIN